MSGTDIRTVSLSSPADALPRGTRQTMVVSASLLSFLFASSAKRAIVAWEHQGVLLASPVNASALSDASDVSSHTALSEDRTFLSVGWRPLDTAM